MMKNDIFRGYGVEIELQNPDDFHIVRESLTRIGISSKDKVLYQSAHILHKQGRYAILHFKELFALDGKPFDITENDIGRRNTIANLIVEWGLAKLVDSKKSESPVVPVSQMKVLSFSEKPLWTLMPKYTIGKRK